MSRWQLQDVLTLLGLALAYVYGLHEFPKIESKIRRWCAYLMATAVFGFGVVVFLVWPPSNKVLNPEPAPTPAAISTPTPLASPTLTPTEKTMSSPLPAAPASPNKTVAAAPSSAQSLASVLVAEAAVADALSGSWSGTVTQSDRRSYFTRMKLNESGIGSIDYPALRCGGRLTFEGRKGSAFTYRESIAYGVGTCTDGGLITITPINDEPKQLQWTWIGRSSTVIGTLTGFGKLTSANRCLSPGQLRTTEEFVSWSFRNSCDKILPVTVCVEYANGDDHIYTTNVPARQTTDIKLGASSVSPVKLTWKNGDGIRCPY